MGDFAYCLSVFHGAVVDVVGGAIVALLFAHPGCFGCGPWGMVLWGVCIGLCVGAQGHGGSKFPSPNREAPWTCLGPWIALSGLDELAMGRLDFGADIRPCFVCSSSISGMVEFECSNSDFRIGLMWIKLWALSWLFIDPISHRP